MTVMQEKTLVDEEKESLEEELKELRMKKKKEEEVQATVLNAKMKRLEGNIEGDKGEDVEKAHLENESIKQEIVEMQEDLDNELMGKLGSL